MAEKKEEKKPFLNVGAAYAAVGVKEASWLPYAKKLFKGFIAVQIAGLTAVYGDMTWTGAVVGALLLVDRWAQDNGYY